MSERTVDLIISRAAHPLKILLPIKALQPTPSRFALGVARTVNFQKITIQIRLPVQGG